MINLDNLTPEDLLVLTNALAINFSKDRSIDEINSIGNLLASVGSLMMLLAAQKQLLDDLKIKNSQSQEQDNSVNP